MVLYYYCGNHNLLFVCVSPFEDAPTTTKKRKKKPPIHNRCCVGGLCNGKRTFPSPFLPIATITIHFVWWSAVLLVVQGFGEWAPHYCPSRGAADAPALIERKGGLLRIHT